MVVSANFGTINAEGEICGESKISSLDIGDYEICSYSYPCRMYR